MLDAFVSMQIQTKGASISVLKKGEGYPLLMLHGYPQTSAMWHKIAPRLAEAYTVVLADLRGYGDSSKPQGEPDHSNYSKRAMAQDMVTVMSKLGYEEFYVVGHDRGARVTHRMALDHSQRVKKAAVLDIIPTYKLYMTTDKEVATAYYHWFFLIQAFDYPEQMITAQPEYYLQRHFKQLAGDPSIFTSDAMAEYIRCFRDPACIHATCEDYRAAASIDLQHDEADMQYKIQCPLLALWGGNGFIGRKYDVLETWRERADNVQGHAISAGHHLAEEAPEETYQALRAFLLDN
jgi:haloacetate dehalogenase